MAGEYNDALRPILPGVFTRFLAQRPVSNPPAAGVTVALPITHDWGPMDTPVLVEDYAHFEQNFGISGVASDTPGSRAVQDAFRGEGLEGLAGAGGVLVARIGASAAAKSSVTLDNPAAADAFKIVALYEGVLGDSLKAVASPIVSNVQSVDIYKGTTKLETYTFTINAAPALATLRNLINASSKVVRVPTDNTGVITEGTTGLLAGTFSLTAGNDGSTLLAGDWSSAWDLFANDNFAYIAPMDVPWAQGGSEPAPTNRGIIAGLVQWVKDENARGHRVMAAVGGVIDEVVADAVARATACASEFVITVGGPGVTHETWGARSTSQMAPRIAGIAAARGETQALHFARLAGVLPRPKAAGGAINLSDAETMVLAGVIPIMRDRLGVAPSYIVKGVTTYTANTTDKPKDTYSNPKYVLSMGQFANEAEEELQRFMIGRTVVNDSTRSMAAARVLRLAKKREPLAFSPGTVVLPIDGEDTDEFIQVSVTLQFGRALAQLFIQANTK